MIETFPSRSIPWLPARTAHILFAIPWIVFAIQHIMYAPYVATIVPAHMPAPIFWVWFTAAGMTAAGISFLLNQSVNLASLLLGIMLSLFVLMVEIPQLISPGGAIHWTRTFQDIAIAGAAYSLSTRPGPLRIGRFLYTIPILFLGFQHFTHPAFITANVPDYFPAKMAWDFVIGIIMIGAAMGMLVKRYAGMSALSLGSFLLIMAILYQAPLLYSNVHNGQQWTGAMLDLAIAAGALIVAEKN